ncbi:hypothetical protein [Salinisphaera sp. T31B1]
MNVGWSAVLALDSVSMTLAKRTFLKVICSAFELPDHEEVTVASEAIGCF